MNTDTKRHIDAARQVLVGVVPNPTSQIDQITNALIYKFMDDMDQAAIRAGGKPSFFVDDFEKYAWTRLMDARIGNQERMNLYSEALMKFSQAKQLPELFRGIFKSAFLPYRSPETLGLFLKEIDYFDYSHPEELGNAYEYLLSIMSSQGDAGQFRTPRHIIDFIVDVVNPKKDEKILDPACGTGGFLVSSYLHILEQHTNKKGEKKKKKELNPDEKKKMMNNFEGYDIDPTMVRIAQVNMYLHQFKNPKIVQYNTLSEEERWGEKFDVILANPPFMSPKGGVKTHSKFSVTSSRSEVLFVDYIMNHLRPKGRAGIIVPEGIIFQSGSAHKELRKNLVNDGLYAVVSLPSGIFQPYSGVKTSILLFDNELAKKSKEILFIKIENDGFDLGAQRRVNTKNDLPMALEILNKWREGDKVENKIVSFVERSRIAENDDYNLSGDRYRVMTDYSNAKWPMVELGDVCDFVGGYAFKGGELRDKKEVREDYPVVKIGNVGKDGFLNISNAQYFEYKDFLNKYLVIEDDILIAMTGATVGKVAYSQFNNLLLNQRVGLVRAKENIILKSFLKNLLFSEEFYNYCQIQAGGGAQGNISPRQIQKYKIPLPPLEIQEQIVAELDAYQNIINGAKQIVKNWKPKIDIDPEWEKKPVSDIAKLEYGIGESAKDVGEFRYVRITDITEDGELKDVDKKFIEETKESKKYLLKKGDVLVARTGATFGKTVYFDEDEKSAFAGFLIRFCFDEKRILSKYFWCFAQSDDYWVQAKTLVTGGGQPQFNANAVGKIIIPLPSLTIQKQIVEKIEAERALVESSKKLIEIYEGKIKEVINKIWR